MNNFLKKSRFAILSLILIFSVGMTAYAEEDDSEPVDIEQSSFTEDSNLWEEMTESDPYVNGIYNVGENARANMTGIVRLGKSGSKLIADYSTVYTYSVDRIGVKNIKLQYKGSLGIWHNVITLDDRYRTNSGAYQGAFSCSGVIGRTYRLKGTHYIINGSYTETRNNVTLELDF